MAGSNVEIVVVDDASDNETAEACKAFSDIRYIRVERNQQLGGARNLGILASRGEFITFLDDDDLRVAGSLDAQVDLLESTPGAALVYGQTMLADQDGVPTGYVYPVPCPQGDVFWELLQQNFISCPSAVFRRSSLFKIGMPTSSLPGIEDWDLWIRLAELFEVVALESVVAIYRRATPGSGQFTSDAAAMVRRITKAHRQRWMKLPRAANASAEQRRLAQGAFSSNMANHLIWEMGRCIKEKQFNSAWKNFQTALGLHPLGVTRRVMRPANFRFLATRGIARWISAEKPQGSYNV